MNTKGVNFQPSERGQFSTAVDIFWRLNFVGIYLAHLLMGVSTIGSAPYAQESARWVAGGRWATSFLDSAPSHPLGFPAPPRFSGLQRHALHMRLAGILGPFGSLLR